MPAIFFADLDALRLALASGAVPPAVHRAPARAGFDAAGRLWLQPAAPLPRDAVAALARLGAAVQGTSGVELTDDVPCWPHLLPLAPGNGEAPSNVLIELPDAAGLPRLAAELRRLGAGKVVARVEAGGAAYALVERPPFATLLRGDLRAYVRRAPRVWVALGSRHPLAELIEPPEGQIALLRPPRDWSFLDDAPFPAGPDHFSLPPGDAVAEGPAMRLAAALRLVPSRSAEPAELWVLPDGAMPRLKRLVEQSDDRLVARLSLAVATAGGRRVAVLRARPSKPGPPALVLDAAAFRPHLRLPNLFVPVDARLSPPLRRDAVRGLLAPDAARVVWLEPDGRGGFAPQSVPAAAFRPLEQFVAYPPDHAAEVLAPAAAAKPFAPQPFEAREMRPPPPPRRPAPPRPARPKPPPQEAPPAQPAAPGLLQRLVNWLTPAPASRPAAPRAESARQAPEPPPPAPSPSDDRRRALEGQFLAGDALPDGDGRWALWSELASVYAAVEQPGDAAVCWLNALWEQDEPAAAWALGWLRAETRSPRGAPSPDALRRWLDRPPSPATVRAVAAFTVWSAAGDAPPDAADLGRAQRLIDDHESALPVRAAWLARRALAKLTGGDVVGLARARDRLLERLYERGLSVDLDVPTFLRYAGPGSGERVQAVRDWLKAAREPVHRWLTERASAGPGLPNLDDVWQAASGLPATAGLPLRFTRAYADLTLAWGLARLGERGPCQDMTGLARAALAGQDAAHDFLLAAYEYRVGQALDGHAGGPLPAALLARLAAMTAAEQGDAAARHRRLVYKAERLRQNSLVLEPTVRFDPFRESYLLPELDDLQRSLAAARATADRGETARRLTQLLAAPGPGRDALPRALAVALDVSPALGEAFARAALDRLAPLADRMTFADPESVERQVRVLERGLFAAAHFDHAPAAGRLIAALRRLLDARPSGEGPVGWRRAEDTLLALVGQAIRSLRRLDRRAEADALLDRLTNWVAPGGDLAAARRRPRAQWAGALRRQLALAGGWFYVGRDAPAGEALDEARRVLFSPELLQRRDQTNLAVAYVAALGHAPPRLAMGRVDEVFQRLQGVSDEAFTATHYSLAQLRLIEAAVRAVVNDDFALGPRVRRWLDDDEYVVRRRVHNDLRAAVGSVVARET